MNGMTSHRKSVAKTMLLLLLGAMLLSGPVGWSKKKGNPIPIEGPPVELSPSPYKTEEMIPTPNNVESQPNDPTEGLSLPPKNYKQVPAARAGQRMAYQPYNTYSHELDLWNLEGRRFIRSPIVLSPDRHFFAYSEVTFSPSNRQTLSRLYRVAVQALPPIETQGTLGQETMPWGIARMNPDKTLQRRERLLEVGYDKITPFDFKTLTIIDWSATGQRLLFKKKTGVLHVGLRTTDVLVYDQNSGSVTIYPELRRAINYYWRTEGNLPNINRLNWELYPLGWEPGSDSKILFKAWAMDPNNRKFLGVWRYDIDMLRTDKMSLEDTAVEVAANGWLAIPPLPAPPPVSPKTPKKPVKPKRPGKVRVYQIKHANKKSKKKKQEEETPRFEIPEEDIPL